MLNRLLAATVLASLPLGTPALADGHKEGEVAAIIGPQIGASAPVISATLPGGGMVDLATISGEEGVALVFYRSADWCPFCKAQLIDLNEAVAPLAEQGWTLAGVSYDSAETLSGFAEKEGISYPLLSDKGSATIKAFGLYNEEYAGKPRFDGIPHPAIVFVSADGKVSEVLREEGYRDRPPVDLVVSTATALSNPEG